MPDGFDPGLMTTTELWSVLTVASALSDLARMGLHDDADELRARLTQDLELRSPIRREFDALDSLAVRTICESVLGPHWRPAFERVNSAPGSGLEKLKSPLPTDAPTREESMRQHPSSPFSLSEIDDEPGVDGVTDV
jgi:hypothetical protein